MLSFTHTFRLIALLICTVVISACGGGGGGGSGGGSSPISLSQSSISLIRFQSQDGQYEGRSYSLHVTYKRDGVLIGYPPGVTPPDWLSIPSGTLTAPDKEFDIAITLTPPVNALGEYSTTLRFVTGDADGSNVSYRDLAVTMNILPLPEIYSGSVAFTSDSDDSMPPATQTLSLDFGGADASWTAGFENTNTAATNWVTVSRSGNQLTVNVPALMDIGRYEGDIVVDFEIDDAAAEFRIPLSYTVTAAEPRARFVAPAAGYINESGTLLIRGNGFSTTTIQDVTIDGVSASAFTVVNDTQIEVHYAAFANAGSKTVNLVTVGGTYAVDMPFLVRARPTTTAGDFTLGSGVNHMVFDGTRDVVIVSTASTLYRLRLDAGAWSIDNQRSLAWNLFDITPDAQFLISTSGNTVTIIDAVTLADVDSYTMPFNDPNIGSWSYLRHMTNSGSALVMATDPNFLVFNYVNKTFSVSTTTSGLLTRVSRDRSNVFILSTPSFGNITRGFYRSSTNLFETTAAVSGNAYSNRIAYSGDGRRLLLGDDQVFDGSLTQLGVLSNGGASNYSLELSGDGTVGYQVEAGTGTIFKYDLTVSSPYPTAGTARFTPFSYYAAFPDTLVTPDGSMMIIGGGMISGTGTAKQPRVVIVPL